MLDLLFIVKAVIIAIVQGITEFLPVSSTGHMIIAGDLIRFTSGNSSAEFRQMFEVVIQLGSIMAIVVLFWRKLWDLVISLFRKEESGIKFTKAIVMGTIPAFVLGVFFEDLISKYLFRTVTVIAGLFIGAVLLILAEYKFRDKAVSFDVDEITWKQAIKIGLFQCLAMWPGMSRSSSTIVGGWISGLSSKTAAEFSFFLAIPVMFGASFIKIFKFQKEIGLDTLTSTETTAFLSGFIIAFLVALLCVKGFIAYIKTHPMRIFAYYRIAISVLLTVLVITGVITV